VYIWTSFCLIANATVACLLLKSMMKGILLALSASVAGKKINLPGGPARFTQNLSKEVFGGGPPGGLSL